MDKIKLVIEDEVLEFVVDKALEFKLGARGLRSICETIMIDSMFNAPTGDKKELIITLAYAKEKLEHTNMARLKAS